MTIHKATTNTIIMQILTTHDKYQFTQSPGVAAKLNPPPDLIWHVI